jgi:hypothetical protein
MRIPSPGPSAAVGGRSDDRDGRLGGSLVRCRIRQRVVTGCAMIVATIGRGAGHYPGGSAMGVEVFVDPESLRSEVQEKYREVAVTPNRAFHFHTGRPLAARLDYDEEGVAALPDSAVESFAVARQLQGTTLAPAGWDHL